jgi:putative SOS response-associated peptidase YedK
MCGRVTQKTGELPGFVSVTGGPDPSRPPQPRYNGAPSQEFWIIRKNPKTGEYQRDQLTWGLIPYWCKDPNGGRKPINAKAETAASLPTFRDAYARRRCLLPIDNFFEWKAIKGQKAKQPYAIAMKSDEPFALAGIWENWRRPGPHEWLRTFCVLTTNANELVSDIHDRMPVIIPPDAYDRWLANIEPDPRDLLVPFSSELMTMWPISTRVNKPENDDPSILDPAEEQQAVEGLL